MKFWKIAFWVFCVIVGVFIISITGFYLHAAANLGYWPTNSHPDPKSLTVLYGLYSPIIYASMTLTMGSVFVAIIMIPLYLIVRRKDIRWKPLVLIVGLYALSYMIANSVIISWFLD